MLKFFVVSNPEDEVRTMRFEFMCSILGLILAAALTENADAQSCGNAYDFNNLAGDDAHPYTPLDGQDGWTAESFNTSVPCGVTATLGYDGTPSLRFQQVGAGVGCDASRLNDTSYAIPTFLGTEVSAFCQADFGVGYWGNEFALAYDVDGNGQVRRSETGERGPRIKVGSHANVGITVVSAAGNSTMVPLSTAGGTGGGDWLRLRLVMNLTANGGSGSGSVDYINLTNGETDWTPLQGMQGIDLELSPGSGDASDPANWSAVWLHFEGATNELDNIDVGLQTCDVGVAYCFGHLGSSNICPCGNENDNSDPLGAGCANAYFSAGARLGASGIASITNDTVVLAGTRGQPSNSSMFFQANNNKDGAFIWLDNGIQCAGGGLIRLKVKMNDANGDAVSSPMVITARSAQFNHVIVAGETLYYQWWYRENDDICQADDDANTSNGYQITWTP
jgi:hypothetical protein